MEDPSNQLLQNLKFGIIYVCGNPKETSHFRWFCRMIEPMISPMTLEWRDTDLIDHTLIVARRFNVGNLGKYATVQLRLDSYKMSNTTTVLAAVHAFSDSLEDILDPSEGDKIINEADFANAPYIPMPRAEFSDYNDDSDVFYSRVNPKEYTQIIIDLDRQRHLEPDHTRVLRQRSLDVGKAKRRVTEAMREEEDELEEAAWIDDKLQAEDDREFLAIERERELALEALKMSLLKYITTYKADPEKLIREELKGIFVFNKQQSPLVVNGDLKLVLQDYNEMELKMSAMCRAVYILFLWLRKTGKVGTRLIDIDQYRDKLMDIYSLVKPGADTERVKISIDNLCMPGSSSLNETISKINRCVRQSMSSELADAYCISGARGETYGVAINPDFITLPRAITAIS